ncbi:MAG: hypothetical protein D6711_18890 [Chloroflexi bacterium]|nr:MAG: hypothetical protein D6711_18890 [Chloroflexota bacterium]
MNNYADKNSAHVLILRLWRELPQEADTPSEWRALIEDVGTSQRYPVRDMAVLHTLFAPYVEAMGLDDFLPGEEK